MDAPDLIPQLITLLPQFGPRWAAYLASWDNDTPGYYFDMSEIVRFVVEDLYPSNQTDALRILFAFMERCVCDANPEVRGIAIVGFLETLQNVASGMPFGYGPLEPFLGVKSKLAWQEIMQLWNGKESLMDVIQAERRAENHEE